MVGLSSAPDAFVSPVSVTVTLTTRSSAGVGLAP